MAKSTPAARRQRRAPALIDVTVVLLDEGYASTAVGPIEVFHSAGRLWNMLGGTPEEPSDSASASPRSTGSPVKSVCSLGLTPSLSIAGRQAHRHRHPAVVRPRPAGTHRAQHAAAALAEEMARAGRLRRRGLHRRRVPGRERPARRPHGDDALVGRRGDAAALSQGRLAPGPVRDRGRAGAVQRWRLCRDRPQLCTWWRSSVATRSR